MFNSLAPASIISSVISTGSSRSPRICYQGAFKAQLTWATLDSLHLLRGEEDLPRIAYVALDPSLAAPCHGERRRRTGHSTWARPTGFAVDSPLEERGFEPSVPRHGELSWRAVSLDIPRGLRYGVRRRD
jgi:hypothetical protein